MQVGLHTLSGGQHDEPQHRVQDEFTEGRGAERHVAADLRLHQARVRRVRAHS